MEQCFFKRLALAAVSVAVGIVITHIVLASCRPEPITGPPRAPVVVENRCALPPKPELPLPKSHRPGDGGLICFTPEEANKLRERDAKLKQWVREVRARCGEEVQDAGSPSTEN